MKVYIADKISKSGNTYNTLNVETSNGYHLELFINSEQAFILKNCDEFKK